MSIADAITLILGGIQICKDLKSLFDESRKDVERQAINDRWTTYIDPIHSFKISWPTQRWRITEHDNTVSNVYKALTLQFKTDTPIEIPSIAETGVNLQLVPFVDITIMDGGIDLKGYTELMTERLSSWYKSAGGTLSEDKTSTKIESNEAFIKYNIVFPNAVVWQIRKIKQFEDKMYVVCGQIIDAVPYLYLVLGDLPKIMNSVVVLRSKQ